MIWEFIRFSCSLNRKKNPTNLLEYRVLLDIYTEFSLRKSDFCAVAAPKAVALGKIGHVVSQLQQTLQVCKLSQSESGPCIKFWAESGFSCCLRLSVVVDLEQYNQTLSISMIQHLLCWAMSPIWWFEGISCGKLTILCVSWSLNTAHGCEMGLQFRLGFAVKNCGNGWLSSL